MIHKKTFTGLILLAIIIVGLILTYVFLRTKTIKTYGDIKVLREKNIEEKAKDRELGLIKSDMKKTLGDYEKVEKFFIPKDGVVDFIQYVENLAKQTGVLVETKSVTNKELFLEKNSETVADSVREEIIISLDVYGSIKKNIDFLKLIEHLPYKVKVSKVFVEKLSNKTLDKDILAKGNFDFKSTILMSVIKTK